MTIRMRGWIGLWLLLSLAAWMAGCGHFAYAQAVPPVSGTYYSNPANLEALDIAALSSAKNSIALAAFSLTDRAIIDALAERADHGVQVQIYLDRGEVQSECRGDVTCARVPLYKLIGRTNITIRVKYSKVLMHLKSYVVDGSLLRDGSANFSEQGEYRQDNSVMFSKDPQVVSGFVAKFRSMMERTDNLTVAGAVETVPDPTARTPPVERPPPEKK